ncbi:MAG: hypothetical protein KDE33_16725, partial [Bacteroidetes bacterium]|nr:hypothetical protein [Bacteroidota bacterium]
MLPNNKTYFVGTPQKPLILQQRVFMNYLSVEDISKSYGERLLFQGISFGINEGQKIGFVAK